MLYHGQTFRMESPSPGCPNRRVLSFPFDGTQLRCRSYGFSYGSGVATEGAALRLKASAAMDRKKVINSPQSSEILF